jgi:hypothetical protein
MQNFKPQEFATQMALNIDNGWGIVRGRKWRYNLRKKKKIFFSIGGFFYE